MISDRDIWSSAQAIIRRYGADAGEEAAKRANELLGQGDVDGCATWRQIMAVIDRMQAEKPADNELVH